MKLLTESYLAQQARWPQAGKHILAQFDDQHITVYQAYRPSIADYAVANGHFGGEFSFNRMSWIKPNFLWMMYRSDWASKEGQERILALTIPRVSFDGLLAQAVASAHSAAPHLSAEEWREQIATSDVRLQWDPDHAPNGSPLPRRAIQLGLRGQTLRLFAREWLVGVQDITEFVVQQRANLGNLSQLLVPAEDVYPVAQLETAQRINLIPTPIESPSQGDEIRTGLQSCEAE